jgi:hypothetical protein
MMPYLRAVSAMPFLDDALALEMKGRAFPERRVQKRESKSVQKVCEREDTQANSEVFRQRKGAVKSKRKALTGTERHSKKTAY